MVLDIIGGIVLSTLDVLVVVPVFCMLLEHVSRAIRSVAGHRPAQAAGRLVPAL